MKGVSARAGPENTSPSGFWCLATHTQVVAELELQLLHH